MDSIARVSYFVELYNLIEVYSFKRDLPVDDETKDFFEKIRNLCNLLELDFNTLKKEFRIIEASNYK